MPKKKTPIKYTSRDFNSIKEDLIDYAKRYYPNTAKDFNEASFGSLTLDTVAYVGDILSYYLDYAVNESFLDSSIEYDNIIRHGRKLGYKFKGNPSSFGTAVLYVKVPAKATGLGPDPDYIPVLLRGSSFTTTSGNGFILNENLDFSNSNNEVVVAEVNETTGIPTAYAIKTYGQVISGDLAEESIAVGSFQEFLRLTLGGNNIAEIISVTDSEGHEYFQVDNLSQNVVYSAVINRGADKELAPSILKPVSVPRRFVVEQDREVVSIQFGFGTQENLTTNPVVDPASVVLQVHGKDYYTDDTFDPTKLLETEKFGVAPANTTIRVVYRRNSTDSVNAAVGTLTTTTDPLFQFDNQTSLDGQKLEDVIVSLECSNEDPIMGDVTLPSSEELKKRISGNYATQARAVTKQDYQAVVYAMPPEFGAIKRVNITQDDDSFKRNLNLYVISENEDTTLTPTTENIKKNLKTWLNSYKMINDTIDIMDARIINLGITFEIVADLEVNKYSVLAACINRLESLFQMAQDIGETFSITRLYSELNDVDGVADVIKVRVGQKTGTAYADIRFDIEENMSSDGRYVWCPENCIFEVKYPSSDIKGSVK